MATSETIGKLALALSKAQKDYKTVERNCVNPFFKSRYSDLASILDATREALASNELAVIQTNETSENGKLVVVTTLMHSSGEWVSGTLAMKPVKDDPQGQGSCLTYIRRYAMQQILGVASEDEDDGNAASTTDTKKEKAKEPSPDAPQSQSGHQDIVAVISDIEVKEGEKEGKKWTKYGIKAGDHTYGTFDKKIADAAEFWKGQEAKITFEQKGKFLTCLAIGEPDA